MAIRGLIGGSWQGLAVLLAQQLALLGVSVARRMVDTRTYTAAYSDLAGRLVLEQRGRVPLSLLAARSTLARQFIDFLESQLPAVLQAAFYILGSLAMLALTDHWLVLSCLTLVGPAFVTGRRYAQKSSTLNVQLHDEMERELRVIGEGTKDEVIEHYQRLSHWRVKLSDLEAFNIGFMQTCSLGLIAVVLARTCLAERGDAGRITTMLGYVAMYVQGLLYVPTLVEQYGRLRDIGGRLRGDPAGAGVIEVRESSQESGRLCSAVSLSAIRKCRDKGDL
jgi:hypothetical protein